MWHLLTMKIDMALPRSSLWIAIIHSYQAIVSWKAPGPRSLSFLLPPSICFHGDLHLERTCHMDVFLYKLCLSFKWGLALCHSTAIWIIHPWPDAGCLCINSGHEGQFRMQSRYSTVYYESFARILRHSYARCVTDSIQQHIFELLLSASPLSQLDPFAALSRAPLTDCSVV